MPQIGALPILAHAGQHEDGGSDEIDVQGLSGLLFEEQTSAWLLVSGKPSTFPPQDHGGDHEDGGLDEISVAALSGLLADAQAPLAHGAVYHTDRQRSWFVAPAYSVGSGQGAGNSMPYAVLEDSFIRDAFFMTRVPEDFVALIAAYAVWFTLAAGGNMYWRWVTRFFACGENRNLHLQIADNLTSANGGSEIVNCHDPGGATLYADLAVGDYIAVSVRRYGNDGLDTINANVQVLGLLFVYTADM